MEANHPNTEQEMAAFVDLMLSDPDFVRREFEAIITHSWSNIGPPPLHRARCAVGNHRPRRPTTWCVGPVKGPTPLEWGPARLGRTRQRSPPIT